MWRNIVIVVNKERGNEELRHINEITTGASSRTVSGADDGESRNAKQDQNCYEGADPGVIQLGRIGRV